MSTYSKILAPSIAKLKVNLACWKEMQQKIGNEKKYRYYSGGIKAYEQTIEWLQRLAKVQPDHRDWLIEASAKNRLHPSYNLTLDAQHYGYNAALKETAPLLAELYTNLCASSNFTKEEK
jgi:hypothetical protein